MVDDSEVLRLQAVDDEFRRAGCGGGLLFHQEGGTCSITVDDLEKLLAGVPKPEPLTEEQIRATHDRMMEITVEEIARVCHEVNRAYCNSLGDASQPAWEDAPEWQKNSARAGVKMHLANPDATPEDSHNSWMALKEAEGWVFGEHKDPEKKTHPCMRPYRELPRDQRTKDYLFRAIVHAMK